MRIETIGHRPLIVTLKRGNGCARRIEPTRPCMRPRARQRQRLVHNTGFAAFRIERGQRAIVA